MRQLWWRRILLGHTQRQGAYTVAWGTVLLMTDQPNFFEQMGDRQIVQATRAKRRAAAKRAPMVPVTALEKEQRRQQFQARRWRHDRRRRIREAVESAEHPGWKDLARILRRLDLERPEELLEHIQNAKWLSEAELDIRYLVLSIIDTAIIRLRERNGLEPFDDALPGEEPTVFELARRMIIPEGVPVSQRETL